MYFKSHYSAATSGVHKNFREGLLFRDLHRGIGKIISTMKLRYAMVCSSNQNRSMEAHSLLKREGFDVSSYGTGQHVKLPGPSLREPNVYDFGTPYKHMFDDLRRKDPELYKRNGILPMLKRNISVKSAPQRWQENAADGSFDVVFTFEEKVFDMVLEGWFFGISIYLLGGDN
ncbi:unnamed protein product [Ilex paraguariensis]|uniref:RNA polymerase II subunit A C-terminal domain phosphatase SSU72 n=1 Tax=Ilex paraguariensis TaxID=185542 RepID=A0ABC8UQ30_9AQUA